MSNIRYTAILATVSNSLCDSVLDYSVNRFNYYKVLFLTATVAMIGQLLVGWVWDIVLPVSSLPTVIGHALAILAGYVFFVKSLKYLPIALAGLVESSSLFLTCFIDAFLGYLSLSFSFLLLLGIFVFSVFLFTQNEEASGGKPTKTIKPIGFVFLMLSVLLYLTAPYFIKLANTYGANEIGINLGYYFVAVPYFLFRYVRAEKQGVIQEKKSKWWNNVYFLCFIIGILEALYYGFETMSFINDTPTVVVLIMQMRVFLLFLLSVIWGTDKFTLKKFIALLLGSFAVTGVYCN